MCASKDQHSHTHAKLILAPNIIQSLASILAALR